mmetsp:Transcript_1192/g.3303  ORF Transcript_1192/g.3303 Transcript_1192/m.3303 type:complete len:201 (-) Transcript_1192:1778-2380(-)
MQFAAGPGCPELEMELLGGSESDNPLYKLSKNSHALPVRGLIEGDLADVCPSAQASWIGWRVQLATVCSRFALTSAPDCDPVATIAHTTGCSGVTHTTSTATEQMATKRVICTSLTTASCELVSTCRAGIRGQSLCSRKEQLLLSILMRAPTGQLDRGTSRKQRRRAGDALQASVGCSCPLISGWEHSDLQWHSPGPASP